MLILFFLDILILFEYVFPHSIKIYTIYTNTIVNGRWGKWGAFTKCTKSCGGGIRKRTRRCNNPSTENGGQFCPGDAVQEQPCNTKACRKWPNTLFCFWTTHFNFWEGLLNWTNLFIFTLAKPCGVDKYPKNYKCKSGNTCAKLAARKGCNKRFSKVLPRWCNNKLAAKDRRAVVKNYCKRSCRNCKGIFDL